MNENLEFLEYLYKTCDMGVNSTRDLLLELKDKDNKVKRIIEEINKEYERFAKESGRLLKKHKVSLKSGGVIADMMSKMGIKMEVMRDNSDSAIADMLIQGLTMGNLEVDKKISNFDKEIEQDVLKIGKDFKKFGEDYIKKLKDFL